MTRNSSKLRELLERASADYKTCDANTDAYHEGASATADAALEALDEHDAEVALKAKREQYEADCRAACGLCRQWSPMKGWTKPRFNNTTRMWEHMSLPEGESGPTCDASRVVATWAKDHPEEQRQ